MFAAVRKFQQFNRVGSGKPAVPVFGITRLSIVRGFFDGAWSGLCDLFMVPVRYASLLLVMLLISGVFALFVPIRVLRKVPLIGAGLQWVVKGLLIAAALWLARPFMNFFLKGWKRQGLVPMLLGALPCIFAIGWTFMSFEYWVARHLVAHHMTLHSLDLLYVGLCALWIACKGAYYAIPMRFRGRAVISGEAALKPGESWTNTEHMTTMQIAEFNDRFERAVALGFQHMGYQVQVNGTQLAKEVLHHEGAGDSGVDVFALKGKETLLIQCKRYAGNVGADEIKLIFGLAHSKEYTAKRVAGILRDPFSRLIGPSQPVMATTTGLSKAALAFAKSNNVKVFIMTDKNEMIMQ